MGFLNELSEPTKLNLYIAIILFITLSLLFLMKNITRKDYNFTQFIYKYMYISFVIFILFNFIKGFQPMNMFYIKITILIVFTFLISFVIISFIKLKDFYYFIKKYNIKKKTIKIIKIKNKDMSFQITRNNDLICFIYLHEHLSDEDKLSIYNEIIKNDNLVDRIEFIEKQ